MVVIRADRIFTPLTHFEPGILLVDKGIIQEIAVDKGQALGDMEVIDAGGCILAPGMIDVHTHGIGGRQAVGGRGEDLAAMSEHYARHGVTAFLATIGGSRNSIESGIKAVLESCVEGAELLGIHLEGPFLNPARRGVSPRETIVPPDLALLQEYVRMAQGSIRIVTLAPEMDGELDLVRFARREGILCSAGHSMASWEQMMAAVEAGVSRVTHTFNAMAPIHHREPGILGAALGDDRLTVEVIMDNVHVHPQAVKLLLRCKPVGRVEVVSDSTAAAGMPDGRYRYEGVDMIVENQVARDCDGTLAGSTTTMDKELINLVHLGELSLGDALRTVSFNQAVELGIENRRGELAVGKDADLICLDRRDLALKWTMVKGRVFQSEDRT